MSTSQKTTGRERNDILKEMIATEKVYVGNMQTCQEIYETPLSMRLVESPTQGEPPLLARRDFNKIFSDLMPIRALNTKLLAELELHYEQSRESGKKPDSNLGDIFLKYSPWFKCYTAYTNQYNNIATHVRTLRKSNAEFDTFLNNVRKSNPKAHGHSLESFLIQPVQRLPRYIMLLSELIKKTSEHHRDYKSLTDALKVMKQIADYVNERIRDFENQLKMNEIDGMIISTLRAQKKNEDDRPVAINPLLIPTRLFLQEIEVTKAYVNGTEIVLPSDTSTIMLYVFNDLLIYSKNGRVRDEKSNTVVNTLEYSGFIHLEAERLPWCYIQIHEDGKPRTELGIVSDNFVKFEFKTEDDMVKILKILVDSLDASYKERKKRDNYEPVRPDLPFIKPLERSGSNSPRKSFALSIPETTSHRKSIIGKLLPKPKPVVEVVSKYGTLPEYLDKDVLPTRLLPVIKKQKSDAPVQSVSMSADEVSDLKNKEDKECVSMCYATHSFIPATLAQDEVSFRKGDLFLVYEKIVGQDTSWFKVKKAGLNCDSKCLEALQWERRERRYEELQRIAKNQKKKVDFNKDSANEKKLRLWAGNQLVIIDDRLLDTPALVEKVISDYIKLDVINENTVSEQEEKKNESKSRNRASSAPDLPVLSATESQALILRTVNIASEYNQAGLIPSVFTIELDPATQQKMLKLIDLRNEEEKKGKRVTSVRMSSPDTLPTSPVTGLKQSSPYSRLSTTTNLEPTLNNTSPKPKVSPALAARFANIEK